MTEAEIDALMTGQEDENGCVNYEGQFSMPLSLINLAVIVFEYTLFILLFCSSKHSQKDVSFSILFLNSFRQTHHVCVRSRSWEEKEAFLQIP